MTFRSWPTLLTGILFLCSPSLWAKTMYITDRIEVGLRSSTSIEQRILVMLKTGDQVQVLEGDKNWSKVKLSNGTVGWIATRFLVDQIKPSNLAESRLQEELQGIKEKNQNLEQEKGKLIKDLEETKKQNTLLAQEKNRPETPAVQELAVKNERLEKEFAACKKQLAGYAGNDKGKYESQIKWFLAGSGVLLLGLLVGVLMARGRRKPNRFY
jgi:SH3 domain protein